MDKLNIGLFGFGCVGSGLYQVLNRSKLLNASIEKIVVKNPSKQRSIEATHFNYDKSAILNDENINVVVELIDDADAAFDIVKTAMQHGKHVVTANKKMIAHHLDELLALKQKHQVSLLYEAAVCGSIPIIRNLEEYYNNDSLRAISAITNGTSNYILTKMDKEGKTFSEVLNEAQKLGFAETDPTLDIDGFDSKFKLTILLKHAFGISVNQNSILNFGIRHIQPFVFQFAKENGLKIRLISFAEKMGNQIQAYVMPKFVEAKAFEYNVDFEFNSVALEAAFSDSQYFKGKGAGSFPTASAVLSDIAALQYNYNYEYKKVANSQAVFTNAYEKRFFVAASSAESLARINLSSIERMHNTSVYTFAIGRINLSDLNHQVYRSNPDVFFAVMDE